MEPTNHLHTAPQAFGDTPTPMQTHSDHHGHTPHTHQAGSRLHLSNHFTTITCSYTNIHTPAWNQTHTKLTQQASLIHTNTCIGVRQTPPALGHMQALRREKRGLTMPPWLGWVTKKKHLQRRENWNTQENLLPGLSTPSPVHTCTPPSPAPPTPGSQMSSPTAGTTFSPGSRDFPHCPVSYNGKTLAQPDPHYVPSFHLRMP